MDSRKIALTIDKVVLKHLMGMHNQKRHGNRRGGRLDIDARKNGGFSYSILSESSPRGGFMVSVDQKNERIYDLNSFGRDSINKYIHDHKRDLAIPGAHIGGWIDTQTNKVYLDISINVATPKEAFSLCKQYKQLAYYDLEKGETVYTS